MAVAQKPRLIPTIQTKRKKLEQDLEHVTQEMYRKNLELVQTNRTLSLLRTIDNLVLESDAGLEDLSQQICMAIVNNSDFLTVGIFGKVANYSHIRSLGWATQGELKIPENRPLKNAFLDIPEDIAKSPKDQILVSLKDISDKKLADLLHVPKENITKKRKSLNLQAIHAALLKSRRQIVGVIVVGFDQDIKKLSDEDTLLLQRISEAVGVALDNRLLYEQNQLAQQQLQITNDKLRALDQAKDDFISMASHQLRTPLTSMKGYVSMVLDGDVGKVTKPQKEMLEQAFTSAQSMVYLIADLLNVSRLRTGKFVIENSPANLADIVEQEVSQLAKAAKAKNLKLIYNKPKRFSSVPLDETKIRQVVMNFADNAVYYTPKGGTITVKVKETPKSIEYTCTDNGIGVSKEAQKSLFGKFFRADNAKKARPDGTGLGLYMAKKVIVAQGGALIFHSQEGKGSTFGFSLPKKESSRPKPRVIEDEEPEAAAVTDQKVADAAGTAAKSDEITAVTEGK